MTLHWWMHWFWITYITISVCVCNPISSRLNTNDNSNVETDSTTPAALPISAFPYIPRIGKAIGTYPKTPTPTIFSTPMPNQKVSIVFPLPTSSDASDDGSSLQHELAQRIDFKNVDKPNVTTTPPEKLITTTKEPDHISKINNQSTLNIPTSIKQIDNRTLSNESIVITDHKIIPDDVISVSNKSDNVTDTLKNDNVTHSPEKSVKNESLNFVDGEEDAEVSTVRALSLETAVGRRAIDVQIVPETGAITPDDNSGLDAASVAGICFGTLVVLALTSAVSFVLYRRRYLNKPQTLNDKCSNADSSGYIDDSTIRENSEEMYSLDNDSFLNSLEAMTIQNYWTDSVKHTKL